MTGLEACLPDRQGLIYCELARVGVERSASEAKQIWTKRQRVESRTALIAGRRAGLLGVDQSFTALIFWFFCLPTGQAGIKAKELKE
jgi:hypothetical protein